jgi:hypothetical protein
VSMPAPERGDTSSDFKADRAKQVTQTVGANPDPPANRSRSVPADAAPPPYSEPGDCVFGPYDGLAC